MRRDRSDEDTWDALPARVQVLIVEYVRGIWGDGANAMARVTADEIDALCDDMNARDAAAQ